MSKSKRQLQLEYQPNEWRKFFGDISKSLSDQCLLKGYAYSTVNNYFSQDSDFIKFKDLYKSCRANFYQYLEVQGFKALFTEAKYNSRGLFKDNKSLYYPVLCKCGNAFFTTLDHSIKCPCCSEGTPKWKLDIDEYKALLKHGLFIDSYKNGIFLLKCITCDQYVSVQRPQLMYVSCGHFKSEPTPFEEECILRGYKIVGKHGGEIILKCIGCGTNFTVPYKLPLSACPGCVPKKSISSREYKVKSLLDTLGVKVIQQYPFTDPLTDKNYTIDVYCPDLKLGFELNGYAFHHSGTIENKVPKDYHAVKSKAALANGIKLYHIWESTTDELTQSLILSKVGKATKVYARNTELVHLTSDETREFFNRCHVDGNVRNDIAWGLKCGTHIMCALSLNQRRIQSSGKVQWEIARFASALQINVVGGYSKLLKKAISYLRELGATELISYCNKDLSPDFKSTVYAKLGFEFIMESGPVYKYWCQGNAEYRGRTFKRGDLLSRQAFQKQKLLEYYKESYKLLPDPCTEFTLATSLGFQPCYNSGNFKYRLQL